jgi:hypothetical protein
VRSVEQTCPRRALAQTTREPLARSSATPSAASEASDSASGLWATTALEARSQSSPSAISLALAEKAGSEIAPVENVSVHAVASARKTTSASGAGRATAGALRARKLICETVLLADGSAAGSAARLQGALAGAGRVGPNARAQRARPAATG